ncbi:1,3-beta-glucanosyltransferase gas1 [Pichia californica]|uniref:1,3-beta-glucanosyltransferase n=1 Tax=Pichia californica TaxID=460514 RepID=A0A9P6WMD5_9ASCO|nr:1,3-beta-glucanosyltransferase gas1 [[Candida] californica]KAG0688373.1 1,3-beta-glucanosyltransferase gas1 [[Candida] californica]
MLFNKFSPITISILSYFSNFVSADSSSSFPTIEVVGNKFFYANNGSQFYIRGVAYQKDVSSSDNTTFVDPLADEETCKRDIPYLTDLNTNVIRVYALDADADHDACMSLLQDAGIYVIADLAEPTLAISTIDPSWDLELYDRYTSIIDMMQGYDNVLGFFAGNEVITNSTNTNAAPFVKAAIRDMKSYISDKGYRDIPVGYSANDDSDTRVSSADYFDCGDDDIKADFYGINMYEWCGSANFKTSGYQARTQEFSNLTVPIFFSEYGCNEVQPRKFTEIGTLFSDEMTDVWSGGIVYMYYQEVNNYGLVSVIDNDTVSTMADYQYYSSEINAITPTSAKSSDISTTGKSLSCPTDDNHWKAATSLPPTPDSDTCDCMYKSLSCIISSDVDEDDYEDLFSYICGLIDCSDINSNGANGDYGSYSFCSSKDKLSYILDLYYQDQNENSSACDFSGSATLVTGTTASTCKSALASGTKKASSTKKTTKSTSSEATTKSSSSSSSTTTKKASSSSSSSVSSISSTSKAGADIIRSSGIMGFFSLIAALLI